MDTQIGVNGLGGGVGDGESQTTRCKFMYKLEVSHQPLCHIVEFGQESDTARQSAKGNVIILGVL